MRDPSEEAAEVCHQGEVDGDPIAVGPSAQGIAVGGGSVWVANMGNDTVLRIDPELCQVQGEPIEVSSEPAALAYGDGGIWVAGGSFGGTLSRIDVASGAVGAAVPAGLPGSGAHGIAVGEGAVWVIDIYEKKVVRIDPGTQEPSMMRSPSMESRKRSPSAGGVRGWPRLPGEWTTQAR